MSGRRRSPVSLPALSLRARVLVGLVAIAVVLVGVSVFLVATTRSQLIDQVDQRLASIAPDRVPDETRDRSWQTGRGDSFDQRRERPEFPERVSDVYEGFFRGGELATLFTPNTGVDHGVPDLDVDDLPTEGTQTFTVDDTESGQYRVLARVLGDVTAITAIPLDDVSSTVSDLVVVEVIGAGVILLVLALVGWSVLRLGVRPLKTMTATATRIAGGELDVRVPESTSGTEAGELAVALNQMMGTITAAIDERRSSEERLRRFVADASHELRTPVTTIRGYAELYRVGGLSDPTALADAMRRTEQESVRMARLVEDMLALARLDEQRPLAADPVDLTVLARDAAADASVRAPERIVTVEAADSVVVAGDDDRLRQVVANLVSNALVHTDPHVPITIRVRAVGDAAEFSVVDTGEGMPPEVAERVTERFFRADPSRARQRGGSGLGLAIVDAVVSAHGGSVVVESAVGIGTTVRCVLPLLASSDLVDTAIVPR